MTKFSYESRMVALDDESDCCNAVSRWATESIAAEADSEIHHMRTQMKILWECIPESTKELLRTKMKHIVADNGLDED